MRRIAVPMLVLTALTLTVPGANAIHGSDVVDALRPANLTELDILQRRLDDLERRLQELQARPKLTDKPSAPTLTRPLYLRHSSPPTLPVSPPVIIPFAPRNNDNDGVLRADQVKIYMHYQRVIPEVYTAGEVSYPAYTVPR